MITTSAGSPRASRFGIASGVCPIDGPHAVSRVLPVFASYVGCQALYAAVNPPEFMTCSSAACALAASAALVSNEQAISLESIGFMADQCDEVRRTIHVRIALRQA